MDDTNRPDDSSTSVLLVEARSDFEPQAQPIGRDCDPHDSEDGFQVLTMPDGPVRLLIDDVAQATLVPIEEGDEAGARGAGALAPGLGPLFLAVQSGAGERLLMVSTTKAAISLNGLPAPLVSVLSLGDQLVLGPDLLVHVSRRIQNEPIATPARLVGQECEICLLPFTLDSRLVICECGAARHLDGEEVPAEERLECASLGPCPLCETERPTSGGLAYLPQRALPRKVGPKPSSSQRLAQNVMHP